MHETETVNYMLYVRKCVLKYHILMLAFFVEFNFSEIIDEIYSFTKIAAAHGPFPFAF